jgi:hypothetical protein
MLEMLLHILVKEEICIEIPQLSSLPFWLKPSRTNKIEARAMPEMIGANLVVWS